MQRSGGNCEAYQSGEYHERHDPRLHQRDVVADGRQARLTDAGDERTANFYTFADK
jgi:hypothetical protein